MLVLNNIYKTFPGNRRPILQNINIQLETGEFCIILGNNGSGKSTLLKTIAGHYPVEKGQIIIDGLNVTDHNRYSLIASVTQEVQTSTIGELTVLENIALSLNNSAVSALLFYSQQRFPILTLLDNFAPELKVHLDTPLKLLSGGQRQTIALLMALAKQPTILLLDEHTSALDPKSHRKVMEHTAQLVRNQQITTLMITHRIEDALQYGDRLIFLQEGKVCLNVQGKAKQELSKEALLNLFHPCMPSILSQAGAFHD